MTRRAKVDDLDGRRLQPVWSRDQRVRKVDESDARFEQDILGLQVAMNEPRLVEHRHAIEQLSREDANERGRKPSERVLLDEFVKVGSEKFEDEAEMGVVNEGVFEPQDVVAIVRVPGVVELCAHQMAQVALDWSRKRTSSRMVTSIIDWLK